MTPRSYIALVPALLLVLAVIGAGVLLNRVDVARKEAAAARDDARNAYGHAAAVRLELTSVLQHQHVTSVELAALRTQLDTCRRRTEWLRQLFFQTHDDGTPIERALPGFPDWPAKPQGAAR